MITIYTSPSCSSCRKAKKWLTKFGLEYKEKNLFVTPISEKEIKFILEKTENGTEDIISTRSKVISENKIDLDAMTTQELIAFIQENPSVLKRPIIIDDRKLQIGYNEEDIRVFIPRKLREKARYCDFFPEDEDCEEIRDLMQ